MNNLTKRFLENPINNLPCLYRGKVKYPDQYTTKDNDWVYGLLSKSTIVGDESYTSYTITELFEIPFDGKWYEIYDQSLGLYTGMNEFVINDESYNRPLFSGDIVEVQGWRRPIYSNPSSQYDHKYSIRAVIKFQNGQWELDYNNNYNKKIAMAKNNESLNRIVDGCPALYDYGYHGSDIEWHRRNNANFTGNDIKKIGNIWDNAELLEE